MATSLTVAEVARRSDLPGPADLLRVVALDGPAGTGKSTVSRELARALGWRFVDTGATYRAATLAAVRAGIDPHDAEKVIALVGSSRISLVTDPTAPTILLDEEDVAAQIRSDEVTAKVSAVSSLPAVRALLIGVQRHAMGTAGSVVEGRDIATVVAPRAALKVYLDARPEVRARRRAGELPSGGGLSIGPTSATPAAPSGSGAAGSPAEATAMDPSAPAGVTSTGRSAESDRTARVARALALRDSLDSKTNKLAVSDGAVHLDTSDLTLDQVVEVLLGLAAEAGLLGLEARE